jgi:hypothetical protein
MPEPLFEPIPIAYRGLLADQHFVDAQQFGRSVIGVTKLANSICHELFWEDITHDSRSFQIRFCVGPSKKNGLLQEIFAISNSGQLPLYSPVLIIVAKKFIELSISAIIDRVLGKESSGQRRGQDPRTRYEARRICIAGTSWPHARQGVSQEDDSFHGE